MTLEPVHIPDRLFFGLSAMVIVGTATLIFFVAPVLPHPLPIHFGLSGRPDDWSDAPTTILWPLLAQLVLTGLISWAYRHPQYTNLPHRIPLSSLPASLQTQLIRITRHLLAVVNVLAVLVMAYIAEAVVLTGLGLTNHLSAPIMLTLVGFLLLVLGVYLHWINQLLASQVRRRRT